MRLKPDQDTTSDRHQSPMNQKNLNYEIETINLCMRALILLAMNQKNLNYEIETRQRFHHQPLLKHAMNQKNLNYEIET